MIVRKGKKNQYSTHVEHMNHQFTDDLFNINKTVPYSYSFLETC